MFLINLQYQDHIPRQNWEHATNNKTLNVSAAQQKQAKQENFLGERLKLEMWESEIIKPHHMILVAALLLTTEQQTIWSAY